MFALEPEHLTLTDPYICSGVAVISWLENIRAWDVQADCCSSERDFASCYLLSRGSSVSHLVICKMAMLIIEPPS